MLTVEDVKRRQRENKQVSDWVMAYWALLALVTLFAIVC